MSHHDAIVSEIESWKQTYATAVNELSVFGYRPNGDVTFEHYTDLSDLRSHLASTDDSLRSFELVSLRWTPDDLTYEDVLHAHALWRTHVYAVAVDTGLISPFSASAVPGLQLPVREHPHAESLMVSYIADVDRAKSRLSSALTAACRRDALSELVEESGRYAHA